MEGAATANAESIQVGEDLAQRKTPFRLFVRRFTHNPAGLLGFAIIGAIVVVAMLAPVIAPYDPLYQDLTSTLQGPSGHHLMGTDDLGRDVLSRVIFGARISLEASIFSVGVALVIGVPLGLIAGFYRGFWDEVVIMRVVDALQAFPFLILALALAATLGPGFTNAMIAIGIGFAPAFIRIVRAQVLTVSGLEYVQGARAIGASDMRILRAYILPNSMAPLLVQTTLAMASAILAEAALSFLGLGVQPPTASWGNMLAVAQGFISLAPWLAYWPGIAIFVAVLGFNLLGDGVRDALDPRMGL